MEGNAEGFWQAIKENIRTERIRMVFVADMILLELRRIILFLNRQMRKSEMLAIELKQFLGERVQAFVPDVIVKPVVVSPPPPQVPKWKEGALHGGAWPEGGPGSGRGRKGIS
ncbi:hypothetical protein DSECCO2_404890 [anaerobic digester metagenome]